MEDNRKETNEALTSTYQEVQGHNRHHHKKLISIEILNSRFKNGRTRRQQLPTDSRTTTEKVKSHTKYTESNKQVKRSIRADK
ncbi:unnamed protein product [Schistosoma margrebowiei]|uniref:Uncharacterized protein n=1 Tax=Schistosoma margrebowiei TaxID=48269 RepID=A0A183LCX0_9TREM|nr:unnamed protein product [Schistosoma margrebowiei]